MGALLDLVTEKKQLETVLSIMKEKHRKEELEVEHLVSEASQKLALLERGLSPADYDDAVSLLEFTGDFREAMKFADGVEMVERTIRILREGGLPLRTTRMAVKRYDRWACQTADAEYGYGPRHGSIWASIGFVPKQRGRAHGPLSEKQSLSCIRLIRKLIDSPDAPLPVNY